VSAGYDVQRVSTADNVGISFRVAGLATRVTAAAIDGLVLAVLLIALFFALSALATAMLGGGAGPGAASAAQENLSFLVLLISALEVAVALAYLTVSQAVSSGRTLGKAALGIRAIRVDGGSVGLAASFLRSLGLIVDLIGIGPILMFFHPQSRRLGDLLAGTLVVRDRTPVTLMTATAVAPVYLRSVDPGPPMEGLGRLGGREFEAVRTFLGRPGLPPEQRAALALRIATPLQDRMHLSPGAAERQWPAELFLERLYLQLLPRWGR
jgi:uncharacterized RDD family membrane protein YckC